MITTNPLARPAEPGIQILRSASVDMHDTQRLSELLSSLPLAHPNVLLVGPSSHIERALAEIRPALRAPLVSWSPTETDRLPETACQTLIVRDVDCLTARQQASLAALASHSAGDLQIVSTARQHVFPLVCEGRFLDALYYQLNVVLLEFFSGRRTRGA